MKLRKFFPVACAFALLAFFAACSTAQKGASTDPSRLFAVAVDSTAFFKYGPQQGKGADSMLPRDTIVTILRPSFGYSKVELKNGQLGYVATMDLRRASADLIAAASSTPKPRASREPRADPADPRLQAPPEPLPEVFPEPTPIPEAL